MTRCFCGMALLAALMFGAGCATCESCLDYGPSAFGGLCADGACGARAGSIITPPGGEILEPIKYLEAPGPDASEPPALEPIPTPPMEGDVETPVEADPAPLPGTDLAPPMEADLAPTLETNPALPMEADLAPAPETDLVPPE